MERRPALAARRGDPAHGRASRVTTMPRIRIDLRRGPVWLQYGAALVVVAAVVALAWNRRHASPGPEWLGQYVLPAWQWIGVAVLFGFLGLYVIRKARGWLASAAAARQSRRP